MPVNTCRHPSLVTVPRPYNHCPPANGNIEVCCVDHALALKLDPNPVFLRPGEVYVELHLRAAVSEERMCVDQIN